MSRVHRLVLPLRFPEGLHPGAGKDLGNRLIISEDGSGRPVLRGTALAGVLRSSYLETGPSPAEVDRHFGEANIGIDGGNPSRLKVWDTRLETAKASTLERTHNSIVRHAGATREQSLFSLDALPPGTTGSAVLVYADPADDLQEAEQLLRTLAETVASGHLIIGGKGARGIGRVELDGAGRYRCFDIADLDDHAAWLDEQYEAREGTIPSSGERWKPDPSPSKAHLFVDLELSIARGQDLLIADGQGLDHDLEPQRCLHADGNPYWRLPGSSLRGVLRAWMNRLAAREGLVVDDRVERYLAGEEQSGDAIAWGFDNRKAKDPLQVPDCPIVDLFGSAAHRGRIHISDGYYRTDPKHEQVRMHVAIDRITGGATEGFLFDNRVLCGAPIFRIHISIRDVIEREARWLAQSLLALDLGLLRLGSSKAVGAVRIHSIDARGPFAEALHDLREDT